jgi:hypothetical protein
LQKLAFAKAMDVTCARPVTDELMVVTRFKFTISGGSSTIKNISVGNQDRYLMFFYIY